MVAQLVNRAAAGLPVDSAVKGVFKKVNFWDTKILQLTRYRMSLSKILAHLRQS